MAKLIERAIQLNNPSYAFPIRNENLEIFNRILKLRGLLALLHTQPEPQLETTSVELISEPEQELTKQLDTELTVQPTPTRTNELRATLVASKQIVSGKYAQGLKELFIKDMVNVYMCNGVSKDKAIYLAVLDGHESGYGTNQNSPYFNYSNMTVKKGSSRKGSDYNEKGDKITLNFATFSSADDYALYRIAAMKRMYKLDDSNTPEDFVKNLFKEYNGKGSFMTGSEIKDRNGNIIKTAEQSREDYRQAIIRGINYYSKLV